MLIETTSSRNKFNAVLAVDYLFSWCQHKIIVIEGFN